MADTAAALTRDDVAGNIRALMGRHRVSGRALGHHLGLSHTAISKRLNGHQSFDVDELVKIADVFGVEPHTLVMRSSRWITAGPELRAALERAGVEGVDVDDLAVAIGGRELVGAGAAA